jgi:hypothetical protein
MCVIEGDLEVPVVSGYKVAVVSKTTGKFYSPATGIEYKVGPVETPNTLGVMAVSIFFHNVLNPAEPANNPSYEGFTAVFEDVLAAEWLHEDMKLNSISRNKIVILKMTLSQNLKHGTYSHSKVFLGKHIDSLEIV